MKILAVSFVNLILTLHCSAAETLQSPGQATTPATNASDASTALEEIVVTSAKRAENPREVPISIAVLQAQDLQDAHIVELSDLARSTPGLGFTASGSVGGAGPGLGNIEIRGVSSTAGQATTGLYLDDAPIIVRNFYSLGAAEPKYFDIDRIEVLRGPQGTLYGASSLGGTIRIVSNQPDPGKTEENVYTEVSNTRGGGLNYQTNAVANIPLVADKAAIRFGVQIGENDGYINRYALDLDSNLNPSAGELLARRVNTDIWEVAKVSAIVLVTDQLTITPSIFYQRERTGDTDTTSLFLPDNEIAKNTAEPGEDTLGTATLNVKYDLGFGDLNSATSFFYREFDRTQDGQAENSEYLTFLTVGVSPAVNTAIGNLPSPISLSSNIHQWTEELRIASKAYDPERSPFTWIGGVYYSDQQFSYSEYDTIPGIDALFANNGLSFPVNLPNSAGPGLPPSTNPDFYFPNNNAYFASRLYDETQRAIFGELSYNVTPAFKFVVGGRFLSAQQTLTYNQNYFFGPGPVSVSGITTDNSAFTPKFAATYDITDRNTLYATVSEGYRLGGDNRQPPVSFCGQTPASYSPDKLWSYEIGQKGRFLDNRLSVNVDAFLLEWHNIQQDLDLACGYVTEVNAGNAQSYGTELDLKAQITTRFSLGLLGSTTHSVLTSDAGQLSLPAPLGGDVHKGDYIAGVPRYTAVVNGEYDLPISDHVRWFARADVDFTGSSHGSLSRYSIGSLSLNPDYERPAYTTVNARLGATVNAWDFALFATNVFNDQKILQRPDVEYESEAYRLRPVTIGLSAQFHH